MRILLAVMLCLNFVSAHAEEKVADQYQWSRDGSGNPVCKKQDGTVADDNRWCVVKPDPNSKYKGQWGIKWSSCTKHKDGKYYIEIEKKGCYAAFPSEPKLLKDSECNPVLAAKWPCSLPATPEKKANSSK